MPEVITKHPEIVIQVLEGGGARCGPGQTPEILTACPPERFCSTPAGETCVYGLDDIEAMTQISSADLAERVCDEGAPQATSADADATSAGSGGCAAAGAPLAPSAMILAGATVLASTARLLRKRGLRARG